MPKSGMGGKRAGEGSSLYEYKDAFKSYQEKTIKYSGTTSSDGTLAGDLEYGEKSYSGKVYTNDEFMEHLEDANFNSFRKLILDSKLTNKQVTHIKNNMTFGLWSIGNYKGIDRNKYKTIADYEKAIIRDAKKSKK